MQGMASTQSHQDTGGIQFWCHSCRAPFLVTWDELDAIRAKGETSRVLCRCKRWIGNIGATHVESVQVAFVRTSISR